MSVSNGLLAAGFVLTAAGGFLSASTPARDANMGAGILFLLGLALGIAGLVVSAIEVFSKSLGKPTR